MRWMVWLGVGICATGGLGFAAGPVDGYPSKPAPLRIGGLKIQAPQFQRSEAGVTWSLNDTLELQLHYERGAYAPMMHQEHDNGILTRLKLSF